MSRTPSPGWGSRALWTIAAITLFAGALGALGGCTSADKKDGDRVEVRKGELLTPAVEPDAPPFGLPKGRRSPDAARASERSD